jgi:hypothetical protein
MVFFSFFKIKMEKLNVDCLILIFNELRADSKFLYSCLLVNKEWYHLVIPILWGKYPFFNCKKSMEKFSNTILSCLPTSSKQLLFDNDIKLPLTAFSKSPTFNYVSLCKFLSFETIEIIINLAKGRSFNTTLGDLMERKNLLEQEIYKLFISQCKGIKGLEWRTSQPLSSFPGARACFSQLYSLNINLNYVNSNNLYEMAQFCKDLNVLYVYNYTKDIPGLISLIDEQRNLKGVSFNFCIKEGTYEELNKALAKKSCTIDYLSLYDSVGVISHSFLTSLVNLKDLTIYYNRKSYIHESYEMIREFQECLVNSKFPNLQFLDFGDDLSCFRELAMLIDKTKGNISNVSVYTSNKSAEYTGMLLEAISNHCPKIEYLSTHLGSKDLIYLKSLLTNCRNLISLSLNSLNENDDIGDKLLDTLTKFSPESLIDITISASWKYSIDAFEKFFESYRGRKLHHFDIHDDDDGDYITTEHVNVIKRYFDEGIIGNFNLI